jgi:hypothetical protein
LNVKVFRSGIVVQFEFPQCDIVLRSATLRQILSGMAKRLVWKNEKAFQGWGCEDCGFILPNPRPLNSFDTYAQESRERFDRHECAKNPLKRREDFSQAAARIVREATED